MKKYFIHEVDDEGWSGGIMTNNLVKDFVNKYSITWEEEFEEDDRLGIDPIITGLEIGCDNAEVWIYKIDTKDKRQQQIGHFNFFKDCVDEVLDFIQENYRNLEMEELDESVKIHRFKDYK